MRYNRKKNLPKLIRETHKRLQNPSTACNFSTSLEVCRNPRFSVLKSTECDPATMTVKTALQLIQNSTFMKSVLKNQLNYEIVNSKQYLDNAVRDRMSTSGRFRKK